MGARRTTTRSILVRTRVQAFICEGERPRARRADRAQKEASRSAATAITSIAPVTDRRSDKSRKVAERMHYRRVSMGRPGYHSFMSISVLVVEDQADIREAVAKLLEGAGY